MLSSVPEYARRVGLVGAAVTDHPGIKKIVRGIVDAGREIGISSLRADRLDEELVGLLARGGYRTLTTASDGASQRLRNLVARRTTEQHLIRAAQLARRCGLHRLKLYELIGLPTETSDDIDELIRFSRELAAIVPVSLAISPFVPKRNTPLDGCEFEPVASPESETRAAACRPQGQGRAALDLGEVGVGGIHALAGGRARRPGCDGRLAGRRQLLGLGKTLSRGETRDRCEDGRCRMDAGMRRFPESSSLLAWMTARLPGVFVVRRRGEGAGVVRVIP